jgi:hypothetical protein
MVDANTLLLHQESKRALGSSLSFWITSDEFFCNSNTELRWNLYCNLLDLRGNRNQTLYTFTAKGSLANSFM